jgi:hypothetical protein
MEESKRDQQNHDGTPTRNYGSTSDLHLGEQPLLIHNESSVYRNHPREYVIYWIIIEFLG